MNKNVKNDIKSIKLCFKDAHLASQAVFQHSKLKIHKKIHQTFTTFSEQLLTNFLFKPSVITNFQ